jgi:hypothetical protein
VARFSEQSRRLAVSNFELVVELNKVDCVGLQRPGLYRISLEFLDRHRPEADVNLYEVSLPAELNSMGGLGDVLNSRSTIGAHASPEEKEVFSRIFSIPGGRSERETVRHNVAFEFGFTATYLQSNEEIIVELDCKLWYAELTPQAAAINSFIADAYAAPLAISSCEEGTCSAADKLRSCKSVENHNNTFFSSDHMVSSMLMASGNGEDIDMTVESIRRIRLRLKPPDGVFNHVRPIWFDPPRGCFLNASLMFYCCMVSSTATPSGARGRDLRDDVDLSTAVIRRLAALSEKYLGLRGSPVEHQTEMPQANKHGCVEQAQAGSSVRPVLSGEKLEALEAFAAMTLSGESAEAEQAYQSSGPKAVLEGLGDEREQAQRVLAELLALISRDFQTSGSIHGCHQVELWRKFLKSFVFWGPLQAHLAKEHLELRRDALNWGLFRGRTHTKADALKHCRIPGRANFAEYFRKTSPCFELPVGCTSIDGRPSTIPVIFEDKYLPPTERNATCPEPCSSHGICQNQRGAREELAQKLPYFASVECLPAADHVQGAPSTNQKIHLLVGVHGLNGSSNDLNLVRIFMEMTLNPKNRFVFFMPSRRQSDSDCDVQCLGIELACQVKEYASMLGPSLEKISFFGHSMGGLIARIAVATEEFVPLRRFLHTFLSFCSPHLGATYRGNPLVRFGAFFLPVLQKRSFALHQLTMKDHPNPKKTLLYRLAMAGPLQHFKNVVLCGAVGDPLVSAHSALLDTRSRGGGTDSSQNTIQDEMAKSILEKIAANPDSTLARYEIHHAADPWSLKDPLRRSIHLKVLDSDLFCERFFLNCVCDFFNS